MTSRGPFQPKTFYDSINFPGCRKLLNLFIISKFWPNSYISYRYNIKNVFSFDF